MNREKKFVKNTFIIALGKVCSQLIAFFLLPLYTERLSTSEYGSVDLLNTFVGLLIPIIILQIDQAIFRLLIENRQNKEKCKKIITTSILFTIFATIIFSVIYGFFSPFWHNDYKIYLELNVVAYIFPTIFMQIARGLDYTKEYSISSFLIASSTVFFNLIFILKFNLKAEGMLLGTMLGQITCTLYLFMKLKLYNYIRLKDYDFKVLKEMLHYSMPLIPNSVSWWVFNASDRIIVTYMIGLSATGILSAANKFSTLYISAYAIIYMSWTESISLHIKDKDINKYFNSLYNTLMKMFVSVALCFISFMPFVYNFLINNKFREAYYLIPILMIAAIFNVMVGLIGGYYIAKKDTKSVASTSIIAAIINIVVNLLLIKIIGLYAAAISTFASYFIMAIYRLNDLKKENFRIVISKNFLLSSLLITIIVCFCYYFNQPILSLLSLLISLVYFYIINKNTIRLLKNFLYMKIKKEIA